jgi:DNA-binding IclR family transcriptional regulator
MVKAGRADSTGEKGRYNVRALERSLRLLEALAVGGSLGLSDLSEKLGISSSTSFRLLTTLTNYGYVEHNDETGGYKLGLACLELARSYLRNNDIRRIAHSELVNLRDTSTETVHLGVLDQWEVVYLEKLENLHAIGFMGSHVGGRSPTYCTGLGKAMLAYADPEDVRDYFEQVGLRQYTKRTITNIENLIQHLDQVRVQGYAMDINEHEEDVQCVAAPIRDMEGNVVAAISVSGPTARMNLQIGRNDLIKTILETAKRISLRFGYFPSH